MADPTDDLPSLSEAGKRASDPGDAPLEGEDIASAHLQDAEHWVRVYEELLAFKIALLEVASNEMEAMTHNSRDDAKVDQVLLTHQRDRYQRRLELWSRRRAELRQGKSAG